MAENIKIRLKVDTLEVEYEGNPGFFKSELDGLFGKMKNLAEKVLAQKNGEVGGEGQKEEPNDNGSDSQGSHGVYKHSITNMARDLEVKKATDYIICAMAHRQLKDNKNSSTEEEIKVAVQSIQGHDKKVVERIRRNIQRLMKSKQKRINEISGGVYSLSLEELDALKEKLKINNKD